MSNKAAEKSGIVAGYFDEWAEHYDVDTKGDMEYTSPARMFQALKPYVRKGTSMLDVGIGTGQLSTLFKKAGAFVAGVDNSSKMLEICREAGRADELRRSDLNNEPLPFAEDRFDIVASCGLTEFINPLKNLVNEMARVAQPGGIVAITYEVSSDGQKVSKKEIDAFHTYAYAPGHIEKTLAAAGISNLVNTCFTGYRKGPEKPIIHGLYIGQVIKPGKS